MVAPQGRQRSWLAWAQSLKGDLSCLVLALKLNALAGHLLRKHLDGEPLIRKPLVRKPLIRKHLVRKPLTSKYLNPSSGEL